MTGGSAVLLVGMTAQASAQSAQTERAKPGDRIVFADGANKGKPVGLDTLIVGNAPVAGLPADPSTGTVRDGSRFNKLLLLRLNPDELDAETRSRSPDGVLAYSAICTHQGCTINAWNKDERAFQCFCHHSEFSPAAGGRPTKGPASASLPLLPLTVSEGALIVAADFTSKPGPKTK